jgi:hypothetical protein
MHSLSALVVLGASFANAAIGPDCTNGPLKDNKICDVSAAPAERAAELVAAMQTSEKLDNLMRCVAINKYIKANLTKTVNPRVLRDLDFPSTTGGEKHFMEWLVLLVSTSLATTRLQPPSLCLYRCRLLSTTTSSSRSPT